MIHRNVIALLTILITAPSWAAPETGNRNGCEDIFNDRVSKGYSSKEVDAMKAKVVREMTDGGGDSDAVKQKRAALRRAVSNCDHVVQKFGSASKQADVAILKVEDAQDAVSQAHAEKD